MFTHLLMLKHVPTASLARVKCQDGCLLGVFYLVVASRTTSILVLDTATINSVPAMSNIQFWLSSRKGVSVVDQVLNANDGRVTLQQTQNRAI